MSSMNYPNVILFDLDGTILDTESLYMQLMFEYNKKNNLFLSKEFYIKNILGKDKKTITCVLDKYWNNQYNSKKYWDELFKFRNEYIERHQIKIKRGFKELFIYLKKNNYSIGIVTSNSFSLVKKLLLKVKINICDFDIIITRDDVNKLKPYPDLYEYAIRRLNCDRCKIIAIEDSNIGLKSALAARLSIINIHDIDIINDELKSKCLFVGTSLFEVINYLDNIGGKNGYNKKSKMQRTI